MYEYDYWYLEESPFLTSAADFSDDSCCALFVLEVGHVNDGDLEGAWDVNLG